MDALDRFRELATWLAGTDIALLELRGPQTLLRLRRDDRADAEVVRVDARAETCTSDIPSAAAAGVTIVGAPCVGVLRHRHPLRGEPLVAAGMHVVAGQALALLQIGHTLVPALAPRDGVVGRVLASDGDALGYGDPLVELVD
jgi:biotin carboxyl carrier protein